MTTLTIITNNNTMTFECNYEQFKRWIDWYALQNATITSDDIDYHNTVSVMKPYNRLWFNENGLTITVHETPVIVENGQVVTA